MYVLPYESFAWVNAQVEHGLTREFTQAKLSYVKVHEKKRSTWKQPYYDVWVFEALLIKRIITWPASMRNIPTLESFSPDSERRGGWGTEPNFVVIAP